jgi:hypothetical protein
MQAKRRKKKNRFHHKDTKDTKVGNEKLYRFKGLLWLTPKGLRGK